MNRIRYGWVLLLLLLVACRPQLLDSPRLATQTAVSANPPAATKTPEPLFIPAPTSAATAIATPNEEGTNGRPNPTLTVWINETSPAHEVALRQMADEFGQAYGIDVEMVLVAPALLPDLMKTAVLSYTIPDIVLHSMAYTTGWTERGILDPAATAAIANEIGRDSFDPAALQINSIDGNLLALPSDGYHQILLYRTDWFAENDLAIPDNYDAMYAAAETIFDPDNLREGFVMATESNLITTHEGFEQIAAANGCDLISPEGEVTFLSPACQEATDFYYSIIHQFSPVGVQTDTSARNAYLNGRVGLLLADPQILPDLATGDGDLAANSGILTSISGTGDGAIPATFGNLTNLGITTAADAEAASLFAAYWFNEFYPTWLAIESERKVPMRLGTAVSPTTFIDNWGTLPLADGAPSLTDLYGAETVALLRDGIAESNRWAFVQGQGGVMTRLYEELLFPIVLQEMLSGYFGTIKTNYELYTRIIEEIPNYSYPITPEFDEEADE